MTANNLAGDSEVGAVVGRSDEVVPPPHRGQDRDARGRFAGEPRSKGGRKGNVNAARSAAEVMLRRMDTSARPYLAPAVSRKKAEGLALLGQQADAADRELALLWGIVHGVLVEALKEYAEATDAESRQYAREVLLRVVRADGEITGRIRDLAKAHAPAAPSFRDAVDAQQRRLDAARAAGVPTPTPALRVVPGGAGASERAAVTRVTDGKQ